MAIKLRSDALIRGLFVICLSWSVVGAAAPLAHEVKSALERTQGLGKHDINIDYYQETVTLNGIVASEEIRNRVENVVRQVDGVRDVHNELKIDTSWQEVTPKPYIEPVFADADVLRSLKEELASTPGVNVSGVEYSIQNGVVTFKGEKANHREIDHILSVALMVPGVKDIRSEVRVGGTR